MPDQRHVTLVFANDANEWSNALMITRYDLFDHRYIYPVPRRDALACLSGYCGPRQETPSVFTCVMIDDDWFDADARAVGLEDDPPLVIT